MRKHLESYIQAHKGGLTFHPETAVLPSLEELKTRCKEVTSHAKKLDLNTELDNIVYTCMNLEYWHHIPIHLVYRKLELMGRIPKDHNFAVLAQEIWDEIYEILGVNGKSPENGAKLVPEDFMRQLDSNGHPVILYKYTDESGMNWYHFDATDINVFSDIVSDYLNKYTHGCSIRQADPGWTVVFTFENIDMHPELLKLHELLRVHINQRPSISTLEFNTTLRDDIVLVHEEIIQKALRRQVEDSSTTTDEMMKDLFPHVEPTSTSHEMGFQEEEDDPFAPSSNF